MSAGHATVIHLDALTPPAEAVWRQQWDEHWANMRKMGNTIELADERTGEVMEFIRPGSTIRYGSRQRHWDLDVEELTRRMWRIGVLKGWV
jgi:hypothetical protein